MTDILQVADQSVHIQPMISKQVEMSKSFEKSAFKKSQYAKTHKEYDLEAYS